MSKINKMVNKKVLTSISTNIINSTESAGSKIDENEKKFYDTVVGRIKSLCFGLCMDFIDLVSTRKNVLLIEYYYVLRCIFPELGFNCTPSSERFLRRCVERRNRQFDCRNNGINDNGAHRLWTAGWARGRGHYT